jgi:hypothetical protein
MNGHVVGDAKVVYVTFPDGNRYTANVITNYLIFMEKTAGRSSIVLAITVVTMYYRRHIVNK